MLSLKEISSQKDSETYYIPIEIKSILRKKVHIKVEFYKPSKEDAWAGEKAGIRFWVNTSTPILNPRDDKIQKSVKLGTLKILPVVKHGAEKYNALLDRYEIPQNQNSYKQFIEFFGPKLEQLPKNEKYQISLTKIRSDHSKDHVENTWSYLNLPLIMRDEELNKQWNLISASDQLQLEMNDLSNFEFNLKSNLTESEKNEIDNLLKELYLSNESDYKLIKEWLHIDSLKEGKYNFKDIANRCGIVLYGPPGTGKTHTATEVLKKIFEKYFGCRVRDFVLSDILGGDRSGTVGGFAHGVSNDLIAESIKELRESKKPVLIFIDEGTDMIKDAKASWGGRGDDWIEQGQEIFKNYLNPKRFPGLIFVVASNLTRKAQMNSSLIGNRLEGIEFPYPNKERAKKLFRNYFLTIKLSKDKNKNPFFNMDLDEASEELGEISNNLISVRNMANFTDRLIENNKEEIIENLDYEDYKRELIKVSLENIDEDLERINEKRKSEIGNKNTQDIDIEEEKLLESKRILKIYQKGRTVEEENLRVQIRLNEINSSKFVDEYNKIKKILQKFLERTEKNKNILNNDRGKDYCNKLASYLEEFVIEFEQSNIINKIYIENDISLQKYWIIQFNLLIKGLQNIKERVLNPRDLANIRNVILSLPDSKELFSLEEKNKKIKPTQKENNNNPQTLLEDEDVKRIISAITPWGVFDISENEFNTPLLKSVVIRRIGEIRDKFKLENFEDKTEQEKELIQMINAKIDGAVKSFNDNTKFNPSLYNFSNFN